MVSLKFFIVMALDSTQPPTEMSTRNISWEGNGGRCVGVTTLPPSCAWNPQRLSRTLEGLLYLYLQQIGLILDVLPEDGARAPKHVAAVCITLM
jgi:hypothetical protein